MYFFYSEFKDIIFVSPEKQLSALNFYINICGIFKVQESPENDNPDSNSMQKQRVFIQLNFLHAGVSPIGNETPGGLSGPALTVS